MCNIQIINQINLFSVLIRVICGEFWLYYSTETIGQLSEQSLPSYHSGNGACHSYDHL
jgi:hypothetical protein